jgi:hypothetical protein
VASDQFVISQNVYFAGSERPRERTQELALAKADR